MPANQKKPHGEIPEEELLEHFAADEDDEDQPVLPKTPKPITVNEADWVEQNIDASFDDEDTEHS